MDFELGLLISVSPAQPYITWWTIEDVLEYLPLTRDKINYLARRHGLPYRDFGRERLYPKEELITWAEESVVGGRAPTRKQRRDAGRPAAVRRSGRPASTHLGIAPMPG